jgi:hypothetical protein
VPSAEPGIEVYAPTMAEAAEARAPTVGFRCPQCGAGTSYSVVRGALTCSRCGWLEKPKAHAVGKGAQTFEFDLATLERATRGWGQMRIELGCDGCGAHITVPPGDLTSTCPFCASNRVVQREAPQDALRPRFLVPFTVDAKALEPIVRRWLGSSWMTPKTLAGSAELGAFKAMYIPYWTFDARAAAHWSADVGHDETERVVDPATNQWHERTTTRWEHQAGQLDQTFDDLLVPGTDKLGTTRLDEIGRFDTSALVAYDASFLAGMHAQAYDVALEPAWAQARHRMREAARAACRAQIRGDRVANFVLSLDFADESWRYVLLPLYVAAYRHEGRAYRVLVNGQTGAIGGPRPVNRRRVRQAIGALLAPGAVVSLVGLIGLSTGVGAVALALGFFLLFVGGVIAAGIRDKARAMGDA